MKNYLREIKSFYQFVVMNFDSYKQKEIKKGKRTKVLMPKNKGRLSKSKKSGHQTAKTKTRPLRSVN